MKIKTRELFDCNVPYLIHFFEESTYPWELLPRIGALARMLTEKGIESFTEWKPGVLVGKDVRIATHVTIDAPTIIGARCEVRPGAYIRGNVITGEGCVLGNSCEYKNCILLDHVQTPHYNYVGDSVLGNRAHLGAGSVCSNLKSDGRTVVIHADEEIQTGLRKVGSFLGDGADVGSGCVLNPGTILGRNTSVYPLTALRGTYGNDLIVKASNCAVPRQER